MSLSPELHIALQRVTACNNSERLVMVVRDDLIKSLQAGQTAVAYAHEAWMQLERLGADVMSIGRLVGFVDRDKLHKAFKDSKLLMRDRDGVADFGMVDQLIREQCESKKDMPPLSIEAFLTKLHTTLVEVTASGRPQRRGAMSYMDTPVLGGSSARAARLHGCRRFCPCPRNPHSHLQKAVLTELTCSGNVWKRTLTRIAQLLRKPNS
ncbi:unnamed protein product [Symbiodinium sp. CCMP2456]|nr:unnamed protein product [Symbiodinium sp. CCMP2456]